MKCHIPERQCARSVCPKVAVNIIDYLYIVEHSLCLFLKKNFDSNQPTTDNTQTSVGFSHSPEQKVFTERDGMLTLLSISIDVPCVIMNKIILTRFYVLLSIYILRIYILSRHIIPIIDDLFHELSKLYGTLFLG